MLRVRVLVAFAWSCGGIAPALAPPGAEAHYGDEWFVVRAERLGRSIDDVKARDAALSESEPPPEDGWDDQLALEAAILWRDLCSSCHGPDGDPGGAREKLDPSPRSWTGAGPSMGFFFGGDAMRAGIYRRIRDGGDADGKASKMPPWGTTLAREQIWALVRHIEAL
jgi:hypothetical protein